MAQDADGNELPEGEVATSELTIYVSRYHNFGFFFEGTRKNFKNGKFQCESIEQETAMQEVLQHLINSGEITTLDLDVGVQIAKMHQKEVAQAQAVRGPATSLSQAHVDVTRRHLAEDMRAHGIDPEGDAAQKAMEDVGGLKTVDVEQPVIAPEETPDPQPIAGGLKLPSANGK